MLRFTLPLCLVPLAAAQESPDALRPFLGTPPIEFVLDPATELWFEVRCRAASDEVPGEDDPLAASIASMRALGALFSELEAWPLVDTYMLCAKLEEGYGNVMVEPLRIAPKLRLPDVGPARVPSAILELAMALDAAAPQWLEEVWPERRARLEAARDRIVEILPVDTQQAICADLEGLLRLPFPEASFPLRLVSRMPEIQEIALWVRGPVTMTAFVALEGRDTMELVDVVLHEILHVSDTRAFYPPSIFKAVDNKLIRNGVRGPKVGSARHVLFYMLAGELVRRHLDPEHVDQGRTSGYYARAAGLVEQLEPEVRRFVTGEVQASQFTDSYAAVIAAWFANGGEFVED